jgi:UTP--glucose-1-phosphate uridylyltransferase
MKIRKAVFPAAGLGTRFLPATKAQPKEMLPLVDKPVIQYVVEEAKQSGIESIIFVTGRGKYSIEDHFDVSFELERILESRGQLDILERVREISSMVSVTYIRQKEPLGLGHAILITKDLVGDEPFAVFLGDDIIVSEVPTMQEMIAIHEKYKAPVIALEQVDKKLVSSYGIVSAEEVGRDVYRLRDMIEKPHPAEAPSDLAIIGRYILPPEIFGLIEKTEPDIKGEIQITNALRLLLKQTPIYGYRFPGKRYDTGNKLGFLKATVEFALRNPELSEDFRQYLRSLDF